MTCLPHGHEALRPMLCRMIGAKAMSRTIRACRKASKPEADSNVLRPKAALRQSLARHETREVLVHKVQAMEVQPKAGSANQRAKR